jgi:hypothetical protein
VSDESISERLLVRKSPGRGRGVFALRDFEEDELIETAPIIVLPPEDAPLLNLTTIARYQFGWRVPGETAVVLGYGALYNHSTEPNTAWENDPDGNFIHFFALRPIAKGEEIRTDYGRGMFWKATVDPPPWWAPFTAKLRRRFTPRRSAVMLATGAAIVGTAWRRRRRARRSSADDG